MINEIIERLSNLKFITIVSSRETFLGTYKDGILEGTPIRDNIGGYSNWIENYLKRTLTKETHINAEITITEPNPHNTDSMNIAIRRLKQVPAIQERLLILSTFKQSM